jgi:hypothetical protein
MNDKPTFPALITKLNSKADRDKNFYRWTAERVTTGLGIDPVRMRKIWSGERSPENFAEGLAILNLIFGRKNRPKVREVWPDLEPIGAANDSTTNGAIADDRNFLPENIHNAKARSFQAHSSPIAK